jgi:ABC-type polysaccharide/polyol phosphate transport system ATPase subunit
MPEPKRALVLADTSLAPDRSSWPNSHEAAISVHGVSKHFRLPEQRQSSVREHVLHPRLRRRLEVLHALTEVSFDVRRGSCLGIVGRNGSGKSTLLRCMAGIYLPDAGQVHVRGRLASFIELGVGFDRELTARENLITGGMLFGLTGREVRKRLDEILSYAELERFVDVKLKNFSSGMATRLAFALTTHIDADILLFDEVIAAGDLAFQQKCFERVAQLRAEGRTLVVVTHDMAMIQSLCDRALLLEHGAVIFDAGAAAIAERYDAVNLGEDQVSELRRELTFDSVSLLV